jgi:hypothetical protein
MTKLEGPGEFTKFDKTNIYSKELAKRNKVKCFYCYGTAEKISGHTVVQTHTDSQKITCQFTLIF